MNISHHQNLFTVHLVRDDSRTKQHISFRPDDTNTYPVADSQLIGTCVQFPFHQTAAGDNRTVTGDVAADS